MRLVLQVVVQLLPRLLLLVMMRHVISAYMGSTGPADAEFLLLERVG